MSVKSLLLLPMALIGILAGCSEKNEYAEPPPPKVTVAQPLQKDVIDYLEFTGTTQAVSSVEVRARVKGFLQSMHFTPGQTVKKGDLLFIIDPREYEAALTAAKAELEAAKAELKRADIELDRAKRLFKQKAGSESDVVKWRGEQEVARAAIMRAQASIEDAELNLSYTQVVSPIGGRVSRNLVDPGNLVGKSEATLLTTVNNYEPIYAYYNLNERDLLMTMDLYKERVRKLGVESHESGVKKARIPLYLGLANEEGYPHQGLVDFAESSVDSETGTLQLRGVFENSEIPPVLIPGLFARLRMPIRERTDALLVSARAIGADQGGEYLLLVDKENRVEKRPIRKLQEVDGLFVIEEGLQAGEKVIVKGLQRARPGAKVDPESVEMSSLTISAMRAAAEKEKAALSAGDAQSSAAESQQGVASGELFGETSNSNTFSENNTSKLAEQAEKP